MVQEQLLYKLTVEKWGHESQLILTLEETSELQTEVCKIIRGDYTLARMEALADEIVDVRLMCNQLESMFDLRSRIACRRIYKIARLKALLKIKKK